MTGLLYGLSAFLIILLIAYGRGKPPPDGPSATGSIAISPEIAPSASLSPLPANWQQYTLMLDGYRLPFINAKGERVFDLYKRPAPPAAAEQADKPKLALLVMGLAYDGELTQTAMSALPPEAGIAIRPEAPYLEKLYPMVVNDRRELWLHMPSVNQDASINEGLNALKTKTPTVNNMQSFHKNLGAMHYYAGIALSPASALPASAEDIAPIIDDLGARGIGLITPDETPSLSLIQSAANAKVPYVPAAINASTSPLPDSIRARLDDGLERARVVGGALVVFQELNQKTLETLKEWLSLNKDQFTMVPPSALAN